MANLYYGEPGRLIDVVYLRDLAVKEVTISKLITLASEGDSRAARALLCYFWAFVWAFEKIIDRTALPRRPLVKKFGPQRVIQMLREIKAHLDEMAQEEGIHSEVWAQDASDLGLTLDASDYSKFDDIVSGAVAGVRELIQSAITNDMVVYFAVLAATEFIAEELSRRLNRENSPRFCELFANGSFLWGDVHLRHHDGPSHLDIDLDLARAFSESDDDTEIKQTIEREVEKIIHLFGKAADDVYAREFDGELIAAE